MTDPIQTNSPPLTPAELGEDYTEWKQLESEQAVSPEALPPFGDPRITYEPIHDIQDERNQGLAILIDGRLVWSLDYYPHDYEDAENDPPAPMEVYKSYLAAIVD